MTGRSLVGDPGHASSRWESTGERSCTPRWTSTACRTIIEAGVSSGSAVGDRGHGAGTLPAADARGDDADLPSRSCREPVSRVGPRVGSLVLTLDSWEPG